MQTPATEAVDLVGESAAIQKLAAAKLTEPRNTLTVGDFFVQWIENKQASGYKPASILSWRQSGMCVTRRIGDKALGSLTHTDGESFRADMRSQGIRSATIHKRLGHARQMRLGNGILSQTPGNMCEAVLEILLTEGPMSLL